MGAEKRKGSGECEDMQTEILYTDNLDVGATLVSPTVAEADFGRSKDRPYNSAQANLISLIHHSRYTSHLSA